MKSILFFLLSVSLFAQDVIILVKPQGYFSYAPVNVGATVSEGQIIFSGASTRSRVTSATGTNKSSVRYMRYGAGAIQDSVSGYQKVLSTVLEDTFYVWSQSVKYTTGTPATIWSAADNDTCYSLLLSPVVTGVICTDNYKITLYWGNETSDSTGQTIVERKYNHVDSAYGVVDTVDLLVETLVDSGSHLIVDAVYKYRVRHLGTYGQFSDYTYSELVTMNLPQPTGADEPYMITADGDTMFTADSDTMRIGLNFLKPNNGEKNEEDIILPQRIYAVLNSKRTMELNS